MSANQNDPFAGVIGELEATLSSASGLVPPLRTATTIVGDIDGGLLTVKEIDSVLAALTEIAELLDGAVASLSPIPVVGEIADTFDSAVLEPVTEALNEARQLFHSVYEDVVKPAIDVLTDLKNGLTKITKVVSEVTITVPQYLNTVQVLSYLLDIAQPLADLLKGDKPGERLATVVNTLQTVKNDVGKALRPFADGLHAIEVGVQPAADELKKIFDQMGSGAKDAIADLRKASNLLKPIAHGFHKTIDAIAPVRWALDALACIVNKILMPVVNWILKVTGLDHLVDEAKEKVLDWIGVQPVLKSVQKGVSPTAIQSGGASVDVKVGNSTATTFEDFGLALGNYRTNRSAALKDATFGLVTAITGAPVDPNRAGSIPGWPEPPTLDGNDSDPHADEVLATYGFGDADPHGQLRRHFSHALAVHSDIAGVAQSETMSLVQVSASADPAPVASIDPKTWPESAAFVKDVHDAVGSVQSLSKATATLQASLTSFEASLNLPDHFAAQVDALATAFKTCDDFVRFIKGLNVPFLDGILTPLDAVLTQQVQDAGEVKDAAPALQAAVKSLATAAQGVVTQMPNASVVDTAVHRMDGWVLGLQQLIATMETGFQRASGPAGVLDKGKEQIEASAKALGTRLEALSHSVDGLSKCVADLQNGLDTYSTALGSVSGHSQSISTTALPAIQHVAVILGKVDSIFDPLSSLLKAEKCVDAGSPDKAAAQVAIDVFHTAAKAAAQPPPASFSALVESFAEKELPLGAIEASVKTATDEISTKSVAAFTSGAATLATSLASLTKTLQHTKKYSYTDPKTQKTYDSPNDLVDQKFVDQALSAIRDEAPARVGATS